MIIVQIAVYSSSVSSGSLPCFFVFLLRELKVKPHHIYIYCSFSDGLICKSSALEKIVLDHCSCRYSMIALRDLTKFYSLWPINIYGFKFDLFGLSYEVCMLCMLRLRILLWCSHLILVGWPQIFLPPERRGQRFCKGLYIFFHLTNFCVNRR